MYQGVGVLMLMKSLEGVDSEGIWAIRIMKRCLSRFEGDLIWGQRNSDDRCDSQKLQKSNSGVKKTRYTGGRVCSPNSRRERESTYITVAIKPK